MEWLEALLGIDWLSALMMVAMVGWSAVWSLVTLPLATFWWFLEPLLAPILIPLL